MVVGDVASFQKDAHQAVLGKASVEFKKKGRGKTPHKEEREKTPTQRRGRWDRPHTEKRRERNGRIPHFSSP